LFRISYPRDNTVVDKRLHLEFSERKLFNPFECILIGWYSPFISFGNLHCTDVIICEENFYVWNRSPVNKWRFTHRENVYLL